MVRERGSGSVVGVEVFVVVLSKNFGEGEGGVSVYCFLWCGLCEREYEV
jgi:hypothetical protein